MYGNIPLEVGEPQDFSGNPVPRVRLTWQPNLPASADELPKVAGATDAYNLLRGVFEDPFYYESFIILFLSRSNRAMGWLRLSTGGTSGTVVDAKIVMQAALLVNASSVILAHNHPSGNANPSDNDKVVTEKLSGAAKLLDMAVLDHIILSPYGGFYSFAEEGLL